MTIPVSCKSLIITTEQMNEGMKRVITIILLILVLSSAFPQSQDQNYVETITFLNRVESDGISSIQYYDCIGRASQSVIGGLNSSGRFAHIITEYDEKGRAYKNWSPILGQGNPEYIDSENIVSISQSTYNGDSRGFSEVEYDALDNPIFTSTSGAAWQGKGKETNYRTNTQGEVRKYTCSDLSGRSFYSVNSLLCTEQIDEDGIRISVFEDFMKRTILERRYLNGDYIDTYYVYNNLGLLSYVLPPKYHTDSDSIALDAYAFHYTYDNYGRVKTKKMPGCAPVEYWYDKGDRIICMQDGQLRSNNMYRFFLYDQLGRLCIQGTTPTCYEQRQFSHLSRTDMGPAFQFTGYAYFGNLTECPAADCEVEVVNYYDDYSFLSKFPALNLECIDGSILGLDYCESYQAYAQYGHAQLTGVWQRANNGEGILTTYVYDNLGQIVKQAEVGLGKRASVTEFTYNYVGDVTMAATNYYEYNDSNNTLEELLHANIQNNYDIPHTKLLSSSVLYLYDYRTGGSMTDTIQHFTYDDFGHITANDRGGTEADMTYSYDLLHGWLESVTSSGGFSQTLTRESHPSKPLYNGSISAMTWSVPGESTIRCYDYEYDGLNRLKVGRYSHLRIAATGGGPSLSPLSNIPSSFDKPFAAGQDYYTERVGYDLNSNITSLIRYGLTNSRRYDIIDKLSMEYEGNQLTSVSDEASPLVYDGASDFKDAITPVNEYGYNDNGALTYDLNRGIRQIEYDHLGNLRRIRFQESSGSGLRAVIRNTEYVYSADGRRLRTAHKERSMLYGASATMDSIDYCGNLILRNGVPEKYLFDGGYVSFDADTLLGVHYYIQDYMGNNRMVVNRDGTTEQITHYYPYGGVIGDISTNHSLQAYKFEGKELDRTFGLDWYDIQARQYDAIGVPRWTSMDPLVEKYYGISPYAYCGGDPVNFGDYDGRDTCRISTEYYDNKQIVNWTITHSDDPFDLVYVNDATEPVKLDDKSIIGGLKIKKTIDEPHKKATQVWTSSKQSNQIRKLFFYLADNSNIEWKVNRYKDGTLSIGAFSFYENTQRGYSAVGVSPINVNADLELESITYDMHNLPENRIPSPQDINNKRISKAQSYIYNKGIVYKYNKNGLTGKSWAKDGFWYFGR